VKSHDIFLSGIACAKALLMPNLCATLRFSTAGLPEPARIQAVRELHVSERAILSGNLEPIEPLEPLPGCLLDVDLTKRTVPSYASAIAGALPLATAELQRLAACHVHDLLVAIVRAARDGRSIAEGRGIAAARLCAIMGDIEARIGEDDLSVDKIASRHRITPRYVHKLFENEGLTFSSFVLGQRLSRAHRMLSDSCRSERNISTIAFAVGFGDLSYFNRAFRRHYGVTPSDVRQSSARADPPVIVSQRRTSTT
jgi:AraC-like DNA-binding protein